MERLKKKFFKEENAIIYGASAKEEKEGQVSNIKIEQKLLACIKEGKDGESEEILHDFTRELSNTQLEIQYTVFIYFSICSKLIRDLKSFDVALSREYDEKAVFQELFQGENIYDLGEDDPEGKSGHCRKIPGERADLFGQRKDGH